jgi:type IV secretion system protein VirB9
MDIESTKSVMFRLVVIVLILGFTVGSANAGGIPRPLGGESRIKIINYTPNTVFKFVGHYEYQSIIEFALDEEIETISMGTPTPWQMVPTGNRIFLKPVEDNATTNMTVITNKRMYFFEMHAEEATGVHDENLNFVIKFVYPEQYNLGAGSVQQVSTDQGPDLSKPELYNFEYSISGDISGFEPLQVFDDGEFTYLKFRDVNAEFPAVFAVDAKGNEGLVNYRQEKGYVVIERVADRFTLRHGPETICIFNEMGKFARPKEEKKWYWPF